VESARFREFSKRDEKKEREMSNNESAEDPSLWAGKEVLITGGGGYFGMRLCNKLLTLGVKKVCWFLPFFLSSSNPSTCDVEGTNADDLSYSKPRLLL